MESMALKEEIRRRRRLIGLTQIDLAHSLGVGVSTVARWEKGFTEPKLHHLKALAELFKVTEQELMYPKGEGEVRQLSLAI